MKKLVPFIIIIAAFISACDSTTDRGEKDNYRTVPPEDVPDDSISAGNFQDNTTVTTPDTSEYMPKD